ncbi:MULTISPECIES: hypothetical protein [Bacillus]|uniref:hypothetical protein n=1 Tax=Bacillus TaxID=1386 RepID=UPI000E49F73C|nr:MULTISPECIES: hypothetical protein [Bacillus subtilis group]MBT3123331.1 hypothetical protein [Bacillus inaquosorum]MCB4338917.1 hypothetical protein [Bacillus subtilis]MCB5337199.1 hypothetical protein [Bacillus amyloliquefaciens]MCF7615521.1 hypothetical protein [Bacillus subtilis]MCL9628435.1 hypothetical protein [Bacillus subtilis]
MAKKVKIETDVRKMRLSSGVSVKEVCEELHLQSGYYSAYECGNRRFAVKESDGFDRNEEFFYDVGHAIAKITKKRKEDAYSLEKNMFEDDDKLNLIYQPLSDELYKKALQLIDSGKNIIQAAIELEIDERELELRIKREQKYSSMSEETYYKALHLIASGKNVIQAAQELDIDAHDLEQRIKYEQNVDVLTYKNIFPDELHKIITE